MELDEFLFGMIKFEFCAYRATKIEKDNVVYSFIVIHCMKTDSREIWFQTEGAETFVSYLYAFKHA